MKIEFSPGRLPMVPTFKDVPVGCTFRWLYSSGRCLKVSDTQSYQLDPPNIVECKPRYMDIEVREVAEIESITLRRVK